MTTTKTKKIKAWLILYKGAPKPIEFAGDSHARIYSTKKSARKTWGKLKPVRCTISYQLPSKGK